MKPHWIIHQIMENALKNQYNNSIEQALIETNTLYSIIDFNINKREFPVLKDTPIMSYGSLQFNYYIKNKLDYYPGFINTSEKYQFIHFASYYPKEWLLSDDYEIITFADVLRNKLNNLFIKPAMKHKQFTGFVLNDKNYEAEISRLYPNIPYHQNVVDLHDLIIISKPKNIIKEYRCVVSNEYITGCEYHWEHTLPERIIPPQNVINMANEVAKFNWKPDEIFVADFAETDNGIKLIELNALSTSGLYHCELNKIIEHTNPIIEKMFNDIT